jgi:hypothetical protein
MSGSRRMRSWREAREWPGSPAVIRFAMPGVSGRRGGVDPVDHQPDPLGHGAQDGPSVEVTVAGRERVEARGGVLGADVAPQRHAVPGHERQFIQRGGGAAKVPVEHSGELIPSKQTLYGAMSLCPIRVGRLTGRNRHGPGWVNPATASCRIFPQAPMAWILPSVNNSTSMSTTRPGR